MSRPIPSPSAQSFGDPAGICCERAASELRAGRPVLLTAEDGQARAVLALDSSTAQSYTAFARAAQARHYLFVTPTR
ncbi:GTP cyclohydrolase II RibA, partial [Xanthomonas oryzae pv. oryzicola]